jgi:hypothetical protein
VQVVEFMITHTRMTQTIHVAQNVITQRWITINTIDFAIAKMKPVIRDVEPFGAVALMCAADAADLKIMSVIQDTNG